MRKVEFYRHNVGSEEIAGVTQVLQTLFLTTGATVREFEEGLAEYLRSGYAVGVTSCTAALHLALLAYDIGPGDEVITTPMSFVATAHAILHTGARPVFVDVEAHTGNMNADLIEELGARYISTKETPILDAAKQHGPFDLIFEGTGNSSVVFDSMQALGKNGVLVLSSVTGGDKMISIPADRINLEFVLGNKVMVGTVNANREYFELGVRDMAQAEAAYPGWLSKLLTDPVQGLENYPELFKKLTSPNGAIKVFCQVAEL